jgi:hypothetical protein
MKPALTGCQTFPVGLPRATQRVIPLNPEKKGLEPLKSEAIFF